MDTRKTTLRRLDAERDTEVVRKARAWLTRPETRPVSDEPVFITVYEAAKLWGLRHRLGMKRGKMLYGADSLLSSLAHLSPRKKLEQVSFTSDELVGLIFFEKVAGNYVGAILADRNLASRMSKAS